MSIKNMKNKLDRAVKLTWEKLFNVLSCNITPDYVDVTGSMDNHPVTFRVYNDKDTLYRVYDDGTVYPES